MLKQSQLHTLLSLRLKTILYGVKLVANLAPSVGLPRNEKGESYYKCRA